MTNKGGYVARFPNSKSIKFATREAYSNMYEKIISGRFAHVGEMYDTAKRCYTGFEQTMSENKAREIERRFNDIDFEFEG